MKTFTINGNTFRYEKEVDGEDERLYAYNLYNWAGNLIASAIGTFKGVREIAKAFLTGSDEEMRRAINENCY